MENSPETSVLTKISEYLGVLLALIAAIGSMFGYLKYGRGKWVKFKNRLAAFWAIPKEIAEVKTQVENIRSELIFENNLSLRQKIELFGDSLKVLKDVWTIEINTRRAMFRSSEVAIFECDKDGNCIWVNDAYEELASRSLDDVRGKGWRSQIHDEDRYKVIKEWERCVSEKRDFTMRYRYSTKKQIFLVLVAAVCIKDEQDNLLSFVGTVKKVEN